MTGRILVNELDYFSILPQNNKSLRFDFAIAATRNCIDTTSLQSALEKTALFESVPSFSWTVPSVRKLRIILQTAV